MNNSFNIELNEDFSGETSNDAVLREQEARLIKLLEALGALVTSPEWRTLKEELFDTSLVSIEHKMRLEAEKPLIDASELYRLQGERKWARRYANPLMLIEDYRKQLDNIRRQLKPPGGAGNGS